MLLQESIVHSFLFLSTCPLYKYTTNPFTHSPFGEHLSHKNLPLQGRCELLFDPSLVLVITDNDPKDYQVSLNFFAQWKNRLALDEIQKKIIRTSIEKCVKTAIQFNYTQKDIQTALQQLKRCSTGNTISCSSQLTRSWNTQFGWGCGELALSYIVGGSAKWKKNWKPNSIYLPFTQQPNWRYTSTNMKQIYTMSFITELFVITKCRNNTNFY